MRVLILSMMLLLPLSSASAQGTGMGWWHANGDSIVLGGTTVKLDGSGIQQTTGAVHDPEGSENAFFHFTFDPPVESLQLWFEDVDYDEKITFGHPLPDHVHYLDLDPEGTPIHTVRGFFYEQAGRGGVIWDGPGIASVEFTASYASGSIRMHQIDLNPFSYSQQAGIDLRPFPFASPAGITLEMAISDPPSGSDATGFAVERQAMFPCDGQTTIVATFPRQPGSLRHERFTDDDVQAGSTYRYRVVPYPTGNYVDFLGLFDPTGWGFEIEAFAAPTSPVVPMILGHGRLVSTYDPALVRLEPCSDSCSRAVSGFAPSAFQAYVDAPVDVIVTGSMSYFGNTYGTVAQFDSAEPTPCIVSVEASTWTNMKALYR
jgi:hypothetical protein